MNWLIAFNALAFACTAAYVGSVFSEAHFPAAALTASGLFMAAIALPFIAAYRALGGGFREIESDYLERRRRDHFPGPEQEIIGGPPPKPAFRRRDSPVRTTTILTVTGILLCAYDVGSWWTSLPPPPDQPGKITNF